MMESTDNQQRNNLQGRNQQPVDWTRYVIYVIIFKLLYGSILLITYHFQFTQIDMV